MSQLETKVTPLEMLHKEYGGKMVEFSGYSMPVQYPLGVKSEHLHTREKAGLFDVSHMGQVRIKGKNASEQLERLVPSDIHSLSVGSMKYTLITNEHGGVLDDLIVTKVDGHLLVVLNASRKEHDITLMRNSLNCEIELMDDFSLLALQGPSSELVLNEFVPGVSSLRFMESAEFVTSGVYVMISRSGYTGEDGFEISIPTSKVNKFAKLLLSHPQVEFIGLGARDSLRLEAGLCLYGQDLNPSITPVEAGLAWVINKRRRKEGGFPGFEAITRQLENGAKCSRVGVVPDGRALARNGTKIINQDGKKIGKVTSGGFGPSIGQPIAMGYVEEVFGNIGDRVFLLVRGKALPARIVQLPFVTLNYNKKS